MFHLYRLQELFFWCKLDAHRCFLYLFLPIVNWCKLFAFFTTFIYRFLIFLTPKKTIAIGLEWPTKEEKIEKYLLLILELSASTNLVYIRFANEVLGIVFPPDC